MGEARTTALPFPVLIGDVGGTNARFAVVPDKDAPVEHFHPVETGDFPDIESAIERVVLKQTKHRPRSALIDLAGPIVGDTAALTNAKWTFRPRDTLKRVGMQAMVLLNDFEALALALTSLQAGDLAKIGGGDPVATEARIVIGPGTGLGVGALVPAGGAADGLWVPVPGEGGHVELGPAEDDEFPIWPHIEKEGGRISAEVLIAGRGIVNLYRAVASSLGKAPTLTTPADVTKAALEKTEAIAESSMALYARLLGRVAGDVALTFMARGGAYIGGGIPPRILPILKSSEFRRAFEAKSPHQAVMATIPTFVIVSDNPALKGLAAFARSPERFGVNLSGRHWSV